MSALKDVISLKFKAIQSDGILLHKEGKNGDHIILELVKGTLSLLISLGKSYSLRNSNIVIKYYLTRVYFCLLSRLKNIR